MKNEEQIVSEISEALEQRHQSEKEKYCAARRQAGEKNAELNIDGLHPYHGKGDSGYFISFRHAYYNRLLPVCLMFVFRNTTVVVNGVAFKRDAELRGVVEVLWRKICRQIWESYELREFIIHPSFFKGSEVVTA